ncbi:MAG: ribonuclease J [Hyphomicrobiaceae bacterium]|nr:ribonuclease J [Hyphomicrobiaceae bacterium]
MSNKQRDENELVLVPLGGAGEIGMNIYLYGYGPKKNRQWLMVDVGLTFPGPEEPGIELIFPDISFLQDDHNHLVAIVLTHAHEDHLGALTELWPMLRAPVYATPFANALLQGKIASYGTREEFEVTEMPLGSRFDIGPFDLEYVGMTHSIPEPNALVIRTPEGTIFHSGDWKIDPEPVVGALVDEKRLLEIGEEGVDVLICDSTNVFKEGHSISEGEVAKSLAKIIKNAPQRVIVTAFSSNVARIKAVALAAKAADRYIVVAGLSLWRVITAAKETGHLPDDIDFLDQDQYAHLDRKDIVLLCTGSQGENRAALARIAKGEHHRIKFAAGDMVIFSSFTIPGNERSVGGLLNDLSDGGIEIVTVANELVHASGHPQRDELKQLYKWLKPRSLIPMHGEFRHLREHRKFAGENDISRSALMTNGEVMRLLPLDHKDGPLIKIDEVPTGRWYLDGKTISIKHEQPMRDRRKLAFVGLVVATIVLDEEDNEILDLLIDIKGIPAEISEKKPLKEVIDITIEGTLKSLPKKKRRSVETASEAVRRAVRAEIYRLWGKKPECIIHLSRV